MFKNVSTLVIYYTLFLAYIHHTQARLPSLDKKERCQIKEINFSSQMVPKFYS